MATPDSPRILPSIQACGGMAEMTCSASRFCFSPVTLTENVAQAGEQAHEREREGDERGDPLATSHAGRGLVHGERERRLDLGEALRIEPGGIQPDLHCAGGGSWRVSSALHDGACLAIQLTGAAVVENEHGVAPALPDLAAQPAER